MGRIVCTIERPKRKACHRYNDIGHAHALTFSCYQREPLLIDDRVRMLVVDAVNRAARLNRFHVWAWVVMPEHVHLLIYPIGDYSISSILKSIKQSVSARMRTARMRELWESAALRGGEVPIRAGTRFWQRGGGYDRNLWSPKYIWETIDYIHDNPVRRGLCDGITDWIWSSGANYVGAGESKVAMNLEQLPVDPRRK